VTLPFKKVLCHYPITSTAEKVGDFWGCCAGTRPCLRVTCLEPFPAVRRYSSLNPAPELASDGPAPPREAALPLFIQSYVKPTGRSLARSSLKDPA